MHGRILQNEATGKRLSAPIEHLVHAPLEELLDDGYILAGSPDTVFNQLATFYRDVGGFGNFVMMVQSGTMGYDLVEHSMELFAGEVLPRFRETVYGTETPLAVGANA